MKFQLSSLVLAAFVACSTDAKGGLKARRFANPIVPAKDKCDAVDQNDCPLPDYSKCAIGEDCSSANITGARRGELTPKELAEHKRRLDIGSSPLAHQFEIKDDVTPLPYDKPCFSPTRNDLKANWTLYDAGDDGSVEIALKFKFDFFGRTYEDLLLSDNGFITFENTFHNNWQPSSLPSGLDTPMIAPFWADAEVPANGGRGSIYYKDFGTHLAVMWDEVGYYTGSSEIAPTHNSFQMVISQTPTMAAPYNRNPELNNICFCYLDMGWTHGDRDGTNGFENARDAKDQTRSATVGISSGYPAPYKYTQHAQIGRFNQTGDTHNGITIPSGVNFLDYLGSTKKKNGQSARNGFCFNSRPNIPPIFKAGPANGTITVPCRSSLPEYKVYFGTPEVYQTVSLKAVLAQPASHPEGLTIAFDVTNDDGALIPDDTLRIRFTWPAPDFDKYGGQSFTYTLEVCDDHAGNPLCIIQDITIALAMCGNNDCIAEKCTPITDNTCTAGDDDVGPLCIPWRSPDHCDPFFSFPLLVSQRYNLMRDSIYSDVNSLAGSWWFHYIEDRAGAYTFTEGEGYPAPELLCCVTDIVELLGSPYDPSTSLCFDDAASSPKWTDSYVIRADGHHSGTGVFVLPSGLSVTGEDTPILAFDSSSTITLDQVREYLSSLSPAPNKIVVERFIPGSGSGASATLPNEYKFHMFNGVIGSISNFMNPGTPCKCYGEFSEDWDCLHKNGCFEPKMPFTVKDEDDDACYAIDFEAGEQNPYSVKGYDFCGTVPRPDSCVFDEMKRIAVELSKKIGVYVRIDMFATDAGEIYVQEYSFNHLGGTRHCASKETDSGCIDSCTLGKLWQAAAGPDTSFQEMGGPTTQLPDTFLGRIDYPNTYYGDLTNAMQCSIALRISYTVSQKCVDPY